MNIRGKEDPYLKIGETNDRSTKGSSDYVWALKDIDFKVEQGDVVGIIGKNGAGKSTLLKLLSKVTGPTTGSIRARGRIGALLEVGTGFHPEMTGRENIFLNGAILGMSKHEIAAKLDEIVDFSGCERYLDTPVKRYSSGMMVRLGFAVAAHLDPEILVVDEVLAVGDAEFQKKAIGKMQDVSKGEGRTVLFVSHNMNSIRNLCSSCLLLENGLIRSSGETNRIINEYLGSSQASSPIVNLCEVERPKELSSGRIFMTRFEMINSRYSIINVGDTISGTLEYVSKEEFDALYFRCSIKDNFEKAVSMSIIDSPTKAKIGRNVLSFTLDTSILAPGVYSLSFVMFIGSDNVLDVVSNAFQFEIFSSNDFNLGIQWRPFFFGSISGIKLHNNGYRNNL